MEGQDRCAAAITAKSTEPPVTAVIAAKVVAGSGGRDEARPALKAAAADLTGSFTAAATRRAEMMEKKNHRLRSRRQLQTRGAPLQRSLPRLAAQHQAAGRGYPQRCC